MKRLLLTIFALYAANISAHPDRNWQSLSAADKLNFIKEAIYNSKYFDLPEEELSLLQKLRRAYRATDPSYLRQAFSTGYKDAQDFLPEGRQRELHCLGVTLEFSMRAATANTAINPSEGVLGPQNSFGILRISNAPGPLKEGMPNILPSMAMKWLVDGSSSLNIQLMTSLIPQQKREDLSAALRPRFFTGEGFTNRPSTPSHDVFPYISVPFGSVQKGLSHPDFDQANHLPLNHLGPKTPAEILVAPSRHFLQKLDQLMANANDERRALYQRDIRAYLLDLSKEELASHPIFELYQRQDLADREAQLTHRIYAEAAFEASYFGDHVLWFQHHAEPLCHQAGARCPMQSEVSLYTKLKTRLIWAATILRGMLMTIQVPGQVEGPKVQLISND